MKYVKGFKPSGSMVVAIIALIVACAGTAVAAATIDGRDLARNSVASSKVKNKTLKTKDFANNTKAKLQGEQGPQGQQGPKGDQGPQGPPGAPWAYQNPEWGQIDRNTLGSPTVALRSGPYVGAEAPPFGVGSLGLTVDGVPRVASNSDAEQAAFGNEKDFVGQNVSSIDAIGFYVYTTGENSDRGNPNMPSIKIEIDPNLDATPSNFSTLQFLPPQSPSNEWSDYIDGTTTPASPSGTGWILSGAAGTATGCTLATPCTFAEVQDALDDGASDATIYTVAIGKGRDYAWAGAVDGLTINDTVYDFEPSGVTERSAP